MFDGLAGTGQVPDDVTVGVEQADVRNRLVRSVPLPASLAQQVLGQEHRRFIERFGPQERSRRFGVHRTRVSTLSADDVERGVGLAGMGLVAAHRDDDAQRGGQRCDGVDGARELGRRGRVARRARAAITILTVDLAPLIADARNPDRLSCGRGLNEDLLVELEGIEPSSVRRSPPVLRPFPSLSLYGWLTAGSEGLAPTASSFRGVSGLSHRQWSFPPSTPTSVAGL